MNDDTAQTKSTNVTNFFQCNNYTMIMKNGLCYILKYSNEKQ